MMAISHKTCESFLTREFSAICPSLTVAPQREVKCSESAFQLLHHQGFAHTGRGEGGASLNQHLSLHHSSYAHHTHNRIKCWKCYTK